MTIAIGIDGEVRSGRIVTATETFEANDDGIDGEVRSGRIVTATESAAATLTLKCTRVTLETLSIY